MSNRITITRGDTFETDVTVVNENGVAEPLTDADITWSIARTTGGEVLLTRTVGSGIVVQDEDAGEIYMFLTETQTDDLPAGTLWHYVVVEFSDSRVKTVIRDVATVLDR